MNENHDTSYIEQCKEFYCSKLIYEEIMTVLVLQGPMSFKALSKCFTGSRSKLRVYVLEMIMHGLLYTFYNENSFKSKHGMYEASKLGKIIHEEVEHDKLIMFIEHDLEKKKENFRYL